MASPLWYLLDRRMGLLCGLDVGTSGCKAVVCDEGGVVLGRGEAGYALSTPRPGWAEQDPEDWWRGAGSAVRAALGQARARGQDVRGVGLTGQMHSLVAVGAKGEALRPAILWCDQRTADECRQIVERAGGLERLVEWVGNRALTGFTAPKVLWMRAHEPEVFASAKTLLVGKDFVRLRLTGTVATEVSDASGTLLFDVAGRRWSAPMIEALGIDPTLLAPCTESPVPSARVSAPGAAATGLAEGTPVVGGAGDQPAGAVGAGVVRRGRALVVLGTSGVVLVPADRYVADREARLHTFCHAAPDKWFQMGVMLSAAGSLRWARDALAPGAAYGALLDEAARVPPGARGVLFLPYLSGERTPYDDPDARGVLFGLSLATGRAEIVRAVLEGVALGIGEMMDLVRALGVDVDDVFIAGGGARGDLWCAIVADVIDRPVTRLGVDEGPAFGAALLAGVGVGAFSTVEEAAERGVVRARTFEPSGAQARGVYAEARGQARALYRVVQERFPALGRLAS